MQFYYNFIYNTNTKSVQSILPRYSIGYQELQIANRAVKNTLADISINLETFKIDTQYQKSQHAPCERTFTRMVKN